MVRRLHQDDVCQLVKMHVQLKKCIDSFGCCLAAAEATAEAHSVENCTSTSGCFSCNSSVSQRFATGCCRPRETNTSWDTRSDAEAPSDPLVPMMTSYPSHPTGLTYLFIQLIAGLTVRSKAITGPAFLHLAVGHYWDTLVFPTENEQIARRSTYQDVELQVLTHVHFSRLIMFDPSMCHWARVGRAPDRGSLTNDLGR